MASKSQTARRARSRVAVSPTKAIETATASANVGTDREHGKSKRQRAIDAPTDLSVIHLTHEAVVRDMARMITVSYNMPMGGIPQSGVLDQRWRVLNSGVRWHLSARTLLQRQLEAGLAQETVDLHQFKGLENSRAAVLLALHETEVVAQGMNAAMGKESAKAPKLFARSLAELFGHLERDRVLEQKMFASTVTGRPEYGTWETSFLNDYPSQRGARYGTWLAWLLDGVDDEPRQYALKRISAKSRLAQSMIWAPSLRRRSDRLFG